MKSSDKNAGQKVDSGLVRRPRTVTIALSLFVLAVVFGVIGTDVRPTQREQAVETAEPSELSNKTARSQQASSAARGAVDAVDQFSAGLPGSTLGVAVLDRDTGEIVGGEHATEALYSASVVKLIVAVDILQRRHTGLVVEEQDFELLRRALGPSDDEAMNVLWSRFDGSNGVDRVAKQLKLGQVRPPEDPSMWGDSELSARDVVRVFDHILSELSVADRNLIMHSLANAPRVAASGFDQEYGLDRLGPGESAVKAGWMCCSDGFVTLHSVGMVGDSRRYVTALLSSQPSTQGYGVARGRLTEAAQVLEASLP